MEIRAASLDQVRVGRDGRRLLVENDVGSIARQIGEIDPRLSLRYNERGEFFEVIETADGTERRVTTCLELDGRLLERLRAISDASYDYAGEIDRLDRQAKREVDRRFSEKVGEAGEKAAHALRKDLEYKGKAFVKRSL